MNLEKVMDALRVAQERGALPTRLGTAELRELGAELLARSVFSARASNVVFVDLLKKLIDELAAGALGEGQVRTAIWEVLELLGYDVERGGFPGEELEPGIKGTLQDLKSFRRVDLIVRTQRDLMQGAGDKLRGEDPDMLAEFPAWELVRNLDAMVPRDWPARWVIAGGRWPKRKSGVGSGTGSPGDGLAQNVPATIKRMIALKGDSVWGELGSFTNFDDALGVDYPPFAFNSGMGWREVSAEECERLGITGPGGETPDEWLAREPATLSGRQPLPSPQVSLRGVDPAIIERFKARTMAETGGKPYVFDFSENLTRSLKESAEAYGQSSESRIKNQDSRGEEVGR